MIGGLVMVYAVMLALYLYPIIKFWGFAHKTPVAIATDAQTQFVDGIDDLRSVLKYIGVLLLVALGFYALIFVGAILLGLASQG